MITITKLMSYVQKTKNTPRNSENERRINLFLRTDDADLIKEISKETNLQHSAQRFAWLRSKKDDF